MVGRAEREHEILAGKHIGAWVRQNLPRPACNTVSGAGAIPAGASVTGRARRRSEYVIDFKMIHFPLVWFFWVRDPKTGKRNCFSHPEVTRSASAVELSFITIERRGCAGRRRFVELRQESEYGRKIEVGSAAVGPAAQASAWRVPESS